MNEDSKKYSPLPDGIIAWRDAHWGARVRRTPHPHNGIVMSLYDDATATVSDGKNCTDVVAVYNYHRSRQRFGHHQG